VSYASLRRSSGKSEAEAAEGEWSVSFAHLATQTGQLQWVDDYAQRWVTNYPVNETFGQLLRRLRENAGYSQENFAELVGLSRKTVQVIENSRGRPRIQNEVAVITKMAATLNIRISELSSALGWVPVEETEPLAWERGLTDQEKQAVQQVADLFRVAKDDPPPKAQPLPQRRARS
jgi:transcriptional regulator with XRE-family HTH domain